MNSKFHPSSILFFVLKRSLRAVEQSFPAFWINRRMQAGLSEVDQSRDAVTRRFRTFTQRLPFDPSTIKTLMTKQDSDLICAEAELVCQHRFDLLGSGRVSVGDPIEWHRDFVAGYSWDPERIYSTIPRRGFAGSDIKRPWELSRFQHAMPLGVAWRIKEEPRYVDEFVAQVSDWIDTNRVGYGVNWACVMDVSIRVVNWLVAFALFEPLNEGRYVGFREKLTKSLWEHARFIETHLEWNGPMGRARGNHFLSDITGLYTLGVFFSDVPKGRSQARFAQRCLEREIRHQVGGDGVHHEYTPAYHRLCLEMFLWCASLKTGAGGFSALYAERLKKMHQFVADYSKPSGLAPLVGDNDDGRLLTSGLMPLNVHRYLMPSAGAEGVFFLDRYLLDGAERVDVSSRTDSAFYPEGGFYFLKNEYAVVGIRAGGLSPVSSHAHNDQLSFELSVRGQDIFVDRGAYVYTSDISVRNYYRSTRAHNVLQINGAEQNTMSNRVFGLPDETRTRVLHVDATFFHGRHGGFRSLGRSDIVCDRKILLSPKGVEVADSATGLIPGDLLSWTFPLAPDCAVERDENKVYIISNGAKVCAVRTDICMECSVETFSHSPSYGVLEDALALRFHYELPEDSPVPQEFKFVISRAGDGGDDDR